MADFIITFGIISIPATLVLSGLFVIVTSIQDAIWDKKNIK